LMGTTGLSFPITEGLEAVWGYEPSEEAMRDLIARHFAFNPEIATDELVRLRFDASMHPGVQESYRTMFPAPRQAGIEDLTSDVAALAALRVPTLLVHGREDRVIPLEVSTRLSALIPNADLHVFGHCGHWTQIERKDAFNALTLAFLLGT
jgi:2-hydroxymuconate-semialdehyde hydrolase